MKVHYFLEYLSVEKQKGVRSDLGYSAQHAIVAAFIHLKAGDQNVVIIPVLEDKDILEEENIEIIDVEMEAKQDEENTSS